MLRRIAGSLLIAMSASGFFPLLDSAHPAKHPVTVGLIMAFLGISGVLLLRKKEVGEAAPSLEARVLEVVRARQGRVTIAAVSDDADLTVAEASKVLKGMHARGQCREDDGTFVFEEFEDARSKRRMMVGDGQ